MPLPENCLKATNLLSKYHFGFNNKKSYFQASVLGFMGNFEQHYESCVLNTQNPLKRALNKVNGLNTSKNELMKIFSDFCVFEYCSMAKNENLERLKTHTKLSKLKTPTANGCHY